jgi:hypothetical protein
VQQLPTGTVIFLFTDIEGSTMNLLSAAELASKQGDSRRVTNLVEEALGLARKHGYTGVELDVEELLKRGDCS